MIIVLCLKVLDSFGKMSQEDMKNTLQIMHSEPRWQINWPIYNFFKQINQQKNPGMGEIVLMSSH